MSTVAGIAMAISTTVDRPICRKPSINGLTLCFKNYAPEICKFSAIPTKIFS